MRRWSTAAAVLVATAAAGCAAEPGPPEDKLGGGGLPASSVDVDSPALRAHKQRAGIAPCPDSDAQAAPVPGGLPDVTLPCLGGGRAVHLAGLRGRPMVINLWASWCAPCRDELPVLQEFHERAGDEVLMLGVDFEDTRPAAALQLLERSGVTYPQLADFDKAIDQGLGPHPVPMTVLVDAQGRVAARLPIEITSADQLADLVEESLGVRV